MGRQLALTMLPVTTTTASSSPRPSFGTFHGVRNLKRNSKKEFLLTLPATTSYLDLFT